MLVLTSDRGFCGGFNANVLREAQALNARLRRARASSPCRSSSGRKGIVWHRFRGREMSGRVERVLRHPAARERHRDHQGAARRLRKAADEGGVDEIYMVYTEFVSMLTQRPVVHRLLPLEITERGVERRGRSRCYEFEPSPEAVLNALLPLVRGEPDLPRAARLGGRGDRGRRRAMKSATDNANELLEALTREANKARQAEITQEISEIVGGANALAETISGSK